MNPIMSVSSSLSVWISSGGVGDNEGNDSSGVGVLLKRAGSSLSSEILMTGVLFCLLMVLSSMIMIGLVT